MTGRLKQVAGGVKEMSETGEKGVEGAKVEKLGLWFEERSPPIDGLLLIFSRS